MGEKEFYTIVWMLCWAFVSTIFIFGVYVFCEFWFYFTIKRAEGKKISIIDFIDYLMQRR